MRERKESCSPPGYGDTINCDGEDYGKGRFYRDYQELSFEHVKFEMLIRHSSGNV